MLVTTHLFIPGPANTPKAIRSADAAPGSGSIAVTESVRATAKTAAKRRAEGMLKLAS